MIFFVQARKSRRVQQIRSDFWRMILPTYFPSCPVTVVFEILLISLWILSIAFLPWQRIDRLFSYYLKEVLDIVSVCFVDRGMPLWIERPIQIHFPESIDKHNFKLIEIVINRTGSWSSSGYLSLYEIQIDAKSIKLLSSITLNYMSNSVRYIYDFFFRRDRVEIVSSKTLRFSGSAIQ